jgi:peptide/nickel transport system substrate-binding protein
MNQESDTLSTWDTNPLWQVVDGPFRLERNDGFDPTTGLVVMVPNPSYSGPVKPKIARFEELPFTSSAAELNAVLAGQVDYGQLPFTDLKLTSHLAKLGYKIDPWVEWGVTLAVYGFPNRSVGPILTQLYVRQALQRLINQPQYIKQIFHGYATPTYGPVPVYPKTSDITSYEMTNPLPYDPAAAKKLLTSHGWKVVPRGVSTCIDPGTGPTECGAGIAKGAALTLNLLYTSGYPDYTQEMEAMESSFSNEGITLQLRGAPFGTVMTQGYSCNPATGAGCSYALGFSGSPSWTYVPQYYPSGDPFISDSGNLIYAGNPPFVNQIMKLITLSHYGSGPSGLYKYENYVSIECPYLWLPDADYQISLISNKLKGITAQDTTGHIYPDYWSLSS